MTTKPTTYDVPAEAFRRDRQPTGAAEIEPRDQPAEPTDHLTIEQRLARLEAWTRNEIFARTACDEPEPVPVTAEEERERFTRLHDAVPVLIDLGLVVSPNDPRLQPLRPEPELTLDVIRRIKGRGDDIPSPSWVSAVIACTLDALNAHRGHFDEADGRKVRIAPGKE